MSQDRKWTGRESRSAAWIKVDLIAQSQTVPGVITNISKSGCRLRSQVRLEPEERLYMAVPGLGQMTARVRWSDVHHAGAEFLHGEDIWDLRESDPESDC